MTEKKLLMSNFRRKNVFNTYRRRKFVIGNLKEILGSKMMKQAQKNGPLLQSSHEN